MAVRSSSVAASFGNALTVLAVLAPALFAQGGGQFAGSESCRKCHPAQFAAHAKTGHSRSLSKTKDHPLRAQFPAVEAEWAFGAGLQAVTFVSQADEEHYLEHGLSWYAASKSAGLTPGHRSPRGERYRIFDPSAAILRCFACHSTGTPRLADGHRIEVAETGVQCESCHGAAADHVISQKPVRNPKYLDAMGINKLCGGCHRMPTTSGDNVDWSNPWNTRHQPLYLAESACFRKSRGRLSCLTCHPAHAGLSHDAAYYDGICGTCHTQPRHKTASVSGRNCIGCHMPMVKPQANLRFANHWIGSYTEGKPLRPR
ncbi:MAG: hypothetical protein HY820_12485 [Acidobacteria bacterium]|nr:hypothetical protein [Acidobacteriota bacterium]